MILTVRIDDDLYFPVGSDIGLLKCIVSISKLGYGYVVNLPLMDSCKTPT